eukprot:3605882-Amphidinium_carterae.1
MEGNAISSRKWHEQKAKTLATPCERIMLSRFLFTWAATKCYVSQQLPAWSVIEALKNTNRDDLCDAGKRPRAGGARTIHRDHGGSAGSNED